MLKLFIKLRGGGLGDQTLDILGALVVAKYLEYHKLYVITNAIPRNHHVHGDLNYDYTLLNIKPDMFEVECIPEDAPYEDLKDSCDILHFIDASASSAPRLVINLLQGKGLNLNIHELIETYKELSKFIKPSEIIYPYILDCGCDLIGIHVRTSDKIHQHRSCTVFSNMIEYEENFKKIVQDVLKDLETNPHAKVFVCGELIDDVNRMTNALKSHNSNIDLLEAPPIPANLVAKHKGIYAVQDMFCLSKCKKIYQTVGYSTFSLLASFIGASELINYWAGNSPTLLYAYLEQDYPLTAHCCHSFRHPELHING